MSVNNIPDFTTIPHVNETFETTTESYKETTYETTTETTTATSISPGVFTTPNPFHCRKGEE